MAASPWPFPGDSREARHRRIIDSYRLALGKVDPAGCQALDEQMAAFGQAWVSGGELIGMDELKTAKEIAILLDISPHDVANWSRRNPELIPKRGKSGRETLYRVGDIHAYRQSLSKTVKQS